MTKPGDVIRYCPKCGSERFNYDGEKAFKCIACGFHFFINSAAAVAAIIESGHDEILLTIRAFEPQKGYLDLPGGFVDPGESVEAALKREIKEELNLDITDMSYLVSYPNEYIFSNYSVFTTDLGFICRVESFKNIHVKDDISGYEFINPRDLDYQKVSSDSIRKIIKDYLKYRQGIID
ncbi:NUDIX domain-containing protein [Marinilabiliaceae bacterium JC017]|nr:NUDIX domain-containing protein [Marinilabiliaceae bacterium JC017]